MPIRWWTCLQHFCANKIVYVLVKSKQRRAVYRIMQAIRTYLRRNSHKRQNNVLVASRFACHKAVSTMKLVTGTALVSWLHAIRLHLYKHLIPCLFHNRIDNTKDIATRILRSSHIVIDAYLSNLHQIHHVKYLKLAWRWTFWQPCSSLLKT